MNFNYSYNKSKEDSIIELICDLEINSIINAINNDFGCSMFTELIKDMSRKSRDSRGKEKLRATKELKETFRKMLNCFPPQLLEKHHLRFNADYAVRHDDYISERYHTKKKIYPDLPSNEEIERIWKTKRKERKELQEQVVAGGSSLKRNGLNGDVVEHICKKLKN